ncbi:MAG: hypothetical protein RLZZ301_1814 [Bacteroidota bacterium]
MSFRFFALMLLLSACGYSNKKPQAPTRHPSKPLTKQAAKNTTFPATLVDVQQLNAAIWIDLKYASVDNFMHKKLYHSLTKAYLQKDVALRLSAVQDALNKRHLGFHLLIYDALRPVSVQQLMWDALDSIPVARRVKFVSNPAHYSLHNFGAAIDLTICNQQHQELDMGAGFDDPRLIAYPSLEDSFLRSGALSQAQYANRLLLRTLMQDQQFRQLPSEWWHFNACSRQEAKQRYQVVWHEAQN